MAKTIKISDELENMIVDFCDDELNYHINQSGCAHEYENEITAQIELLRLLGYKDLASGYDADYQAYLSDHPELNSKAPEPIIYPEGTLGDWDTPEGMVYLTILTPDGKTLWEGDAFSLDDVPDEYLSLEIQDQYPEYLDDWAVVVKA